MGKNCVQQVREALDNYVIYHPLLPHPTAINSYQQSVFHLLTHRPTEFTNRVSQSPYTGLFNQPTERKRMLSTLSTIPITTIITYI